ncbi:glucosylceramidase [Enterocloster citroniae]|uniref:glycoside hydrolase family 30 protein n=1 Tax=Enterocloster citroniae TaxID=358743 RepID=UPI001D07B1B0|nr:glycoside hydrolase family 30 protein [Enterocloster citroniae]MCB7064554.1 glucosylceramidase [Enterocloster citroniae]
MVGRSIEVICSSRNGGCFNNCPNVFFYQDVNEVEKELLCIYPEVEYQELEGFGGAITESVAHNLCRMGPEKQEEVINAYFDPVQGIGLNFCRTHIGSCDFSTETYSYDDIPGDFGLEKFHIDHDRRELLPALKAVLKKRPDLKVLASPWSPPAWMKTNASMLEGGSVKESCRQVWADYIVRYLQEYEKEGIPVWGLTVQNEAKASQTWESCVYTGKEEKEFVRDYLGPALCRDGREDLKILIWDHNKERVVERVSEAMEDRKAAGYIYGAAIHWYSGEHFEALQVAHEKYPQLHLFSTENSMGRYPDYTWDMGERIAHGVIGDLKNHVSAWFAWNLILDEGGFPNHDHPMGKSPMMVDFRLDGALHYDSAYYYLGHFSKYIRPGASRIGSSIYTDKLENITFRNPDGSMVTVILNRTDEGIKFILKYEQKLADFISAPHSITTLCYGP